MYIAVAVSGGVDSLCALLRLKDEGHKLLALHARLLDSDQNEKKLALVMKRLGIPFLSTDLSSSFEREVLGPYYASLSRAETPNPCALCNSKIKFGQLFKIAQKKGCDCLATGHYVRKIRHGNSFFLAPASFSPKDQSYFLSLIPPQILPQLIFPLAELSKDQCRDMLADAGLRAPEEKESQDICFLPEDPILKEKGITSALKARKLEDGADGPVLLVDGQMCLLRKERHRGLRHYTEGQRQGLGLPYREKLYVLKRDTGKNTLVVGPQALLGMDALTAGNLNFFAPPSQWPQELLVQVRSRQNWNRASAVIEGDRLKIRFEETVFPTAPGQLVCLRSRSGLIFAGGLADTVHMTSDKLLLSL